MKKVRLLFVVDDIGNFENFSVPLLSAIAKRDGHEVELVKYGPNPKKAVEKMQSFAPDIVAYSLCSNEAERYLEINAELSKEHDFFSLFGGPHTTFFPSFIGKEGVDGICRGEADLVFPLFLKRFGKESMYNVDNFSFKRADGGVKENLIRKLVPDLDALPFPDREIVYSQSRFLAENPIKTFLAGRGCPFDCSYCFNHAYNAMYRGKGKVLREKSVSYLIKEILDVKKKYPLTFIKFHDDIFGANQQWLEEFAKRFPKEVGVPFMCYARPNMLSPDYCRLLKEAGCYSVCLAIECGNERIRNEILNRNLTDEQILSGSQNLKREGIRIYALNMVGLPSETIDDVFSTIDLNRRIGADFYDVSVFQPYPGTRLTKYCIDNGFLDPANERFESQFSESLLNFDEEFKERVYVLHKMFAILIDHPWMKRILPALYLAVRLPLMKALLNYVFRIYYGYNVHKRIFASSIPLLVRVRGAMILLLSKHRS